MKKMLALGALAIALTGASEQKASAWINSKFSIGLNWEFQSGNNNFLWGMYRNGPTPGQDYVSGSVFPHQGHGMPNYGHGMPYEGHGMPYEGHGMPYEGHGFSSMSPGFSAPMPTPHSAPAAAYHPSYANPYHNVNYGYYSMPTYYYPATWYGR